jgi:RHS repeat-associated protein
MNQRPMAGAATWTYDAVGRRATMRDPGGITLYGYDAVGRMSLKRTPVGSLLYSYDDAGRLAGIDAAVEGTVVHGMRYRYDDLGRLEAVLDHDGNQVLADYGYHPAGSLAEVAYGNHLTTTYTYDDRHRLQALRTRAADGTLRAGYTYALDRAGRRTGVSDVHTGAQVGYRYDALGRLTQEVRAGGSQPSAADWQTIAYRFDAVGNRLSRNVSDGLFPDQAFGYTANDHLDHHLYDANGNTLVAGGDHFQYDAQNRLISRLSSSSADAARIAYSGDGQLRSLTTDTGTTTHYLVDELNPTGYTQVIAEFTDSGTLQAAYTYGLDLISRHSPTEGIRYYGYDGHGSVRQLTDATGAITDTYDYDAYGILIGRTGTSEQPYLYAGERFIAELGLYYNRARYMDVETGRFWTMDVWEGGNSSPMSLHKYLYAHANPVMGVDPSGYLTLMSLQRQMTICQMLFTAGGGALSVSETYNTFRENGIAGIGAEFAVGAVIGAGGKVVIGIFQRIGTRLYRYLTDIDGIVGDIEIAPPSLNGGVAPQVRINKLSGDLGEDVVAKQLVDSGHQILGRQVSARTSQGRRVIDFLVVKDGAIMAVESKAGGARRSAAQQMKDALLASEGGILVGRNAPSDLVGQHVVIETFVRQVTH